MCGIVGVVNINNSARPLKECAMHDLHTAMNVQRHRGPDDQGVCCFCFEDAKSHSVANAFDLNPERSMDGIIGFNRLSIKDLSMAGHQPMRALGGKVILAFNGEVYNDSELRKELGAKGHSFKGTADTEVVMNLYLELGFEEMLNRLNGMFAIVIADLRLGRIFMARDRVGIKPLYYTFYKGRLAFSSELKSIIQFRDFERELDMNAFNARLVFSRPSNKVLLSGVEMLDPGQAVTISRHGDTRFWQFYDINAHERAEGKYSNIDEVLEEAEDVLSDVAKRQMLSDVKVGCQLSGGVDSSLVSYFANKMDGNRLNDGISIIDDAGDAGEEFYIDQAGNALGLDVHKYKMEPDYFLENYQRMTWYNDAPVYSPYFSCHQKLAEKAKDHVTVTLSGEGADEIAGGYNRFAAGVYQPFISKIGIHSSTLTSYNSYAEYAVMSDATSTNFLSMGWQNADDLIREQMASFNGFSGSNFTKQVKFEMTQRLPEGLMRQDKMNMAHSVENRVPLLDNKFIDFVMQLPEEMLLRFRAPSPLTLSNNPFEWAAGKYFLKELCARKFGHDFAYRKKTIMVLDKRDMLSFSGFRSLFYDSIYPGMKDRGLVDAKLVRSWYDDVTGISEKSFCSLWRAMNLEVWCQLFLDSRGACVFIKKAVIDLQSLESPIRQEAVSALVAGSTILLSGLIFTGRDVALPKLVKLIESGGLVAAGIDLQGSVIFHTAVSPAGVGPTSSNKYDIESTIPALSNAGVKIHLGKGRLSQKTIEALKEYNSVYAVIPPVTALLESKIIQRKVFAFPEEGMEALHMLKVKDFPCIVAAAHGMCVYGD